MLKKCYKSELFFLLALPVLSLLFIASPIAVLRQAGSLFWLLIFPFIPLAQIIWSEEKLNKYETLLAALAAGLCIGPFYLLALKGIGFPSFALVLTPLCLYYFFFLLAFSLKRSGARSLSEQKTAPVSASTWILTGVFLFLLSSCLLNVGLKNPGGNLFYPFIKFNQNFYRYYVWTFHFDFLKHLAFTAELEKFNPLLPLNPYMSGERLHYYWFYHLMAAGIGKLSGIHPTANQTSLAFFLSLSFLLSVLTVIRRFTRSKTVLIYLILFLGLTPSYEYAKAFIIQTGGDIPFPLSISFFSQLFSYANVEWLITKYHHLFRNYLYLQHVICGLLLGVWSFPLILRKQKSIRSLLPAALLCSVIVMYNSFIFIGIAVSSALYLLLRFREKPSKALLYGTLFTFIISLVDLRFIILPLLLLTLALFRPILRKLPAFAAFILPVALTGLMLMKWLIDPDPPAQLLRFAPGLLLRDVFVNLKANNSIPSYLTEALSWRSIPAAVLFYTLLFFPLLPLHFKPERSKKKIARIIIISAGIAGLALIHAAPHAFKSFNFLMKAADNFFALTLCALEISPPLIFAFFLLFKMGSLQKNPLLKLSLTGFLVTFLLLNLFFIVNQSDYILKISVLNFLFLAILGSFGASFFHECIRKKSMGARRILTALAVFSLILAFPALYQDLKLHMDSRTSTFALNRERMEIVAWVRENTGACDIVQEMPVAANMDSFHHMGPAFMQRRSVFSDPWHAAFGSAKFKIQRTREILTTALNIDDPYLNHLILKILGVDYLFIYERNAESTNLLENMFRSLPPRIVPEFVNKDYAIFQLKKIQPKIYFQPLPPPPLFNSLTDRTTVMGIPFIKVTRTKEIDPFGLKRNEADDSTYCFPINRRGVYAILLMGNSVRIWEKTPILERDLGEIRVIYEQGPAGKFDVTFEKNYFHPPTAHQKIMKHFDQLCFLGPYEISGGRIDGEIIRILPADPNRRIRQITVQSHNQKHPVAITAVTLVQEKADD